MNPLVLQPKDIAHLWPGIFLSISQELALSRQAWLVNYVYPDLWGHQAGCPSASQSSNCLFLTEYQTVCHSSVSLLIQITCVPRCCMRSPHCCWLSFGVSRAKQHCTHKFSVQSRLSSFIQLYPVFFTWQLKRYQNRYLISKKYIGHLIHVALAILYCYIFGCCCCCF